MSYMLRQVLVILGRVVIVLRWLRLLLIRSLSQSSLTLLLRHPSFTHRPILQIDHLKLGRALRLPLVDLVEHNAVAEVRHGRHDGFGELRVRQLGDVELGGVVEAVA